MLRNILRLDQLVVESGDILTGEYTLNEQRYAQYVDSVCDGTFDLFRVHKLALAEWIEDNFTRLRQEYSLDEYGRDANGRDVLGDVVSGFRFLTNATNEEYFNNRRDLFQDRELSKQFILEIAAQQKRIFFDGGIHYLQNQDFWMTHDEAHHQCKRADDFFSQEGNDIVQQILADFNYSFFTGQTMAMPETMLELTLQETIDRDMTGGIGMSNVNLGNLSIASLVRGYMIKRIREGERIFEINDLGKGNGGTVAAIYKGIKAAIEETRDELGGKKLNVTIQGVERCHSFFTYMRDTFLPVLQARARQEIGDAVDLSVDVSEGDALDYVRNLTHGKGTIIYTSNYVFHRFPDSKKRAIVEQIGINLQGRADAAFFFADMTRNDSDLNEQYFNVGLNGPLNSGNDRQLMVDMLRASRFGKVIPFLSGERGYLRLMSMEDRRYAGIENGFLMGYRQCEDRHQGFVVASYWQPQT